MGPWIQKWPKMTQKRPKMGPKGPKNAIFQNFMADYENSDFFSEKNALCFLFGPKLSKKQIFQKSEP